MLKVAVLSGKGGTGKTTVSASLAKSWPRAIYVDCDVEEPNGFIFLEPGADLEEEVEVLVPEIDHDLCTACGDCVRICQFNALALVKERVMTFHELCHNCGACALVCKPYAITEVDRTIGIINYNRQQNFFQGRLNIGQPAGIPIIDLLKTKASQPDQSQDQVVIYDCPPGASCAVVASIDGCDYAIIVTEPTPFGLNDLQIAVKLCRQMEIKAGVIINKAIPDQQMINDFCQQENLPVLMEIPYQREIAAAYARGLLPVDTDPSRAQQFTDLYQQIRREVEA